MPSTVAAEAAPRDELVVNVIGFSVSSHGAAVSAGETGAGVNKVGVGGVGRSTLIKSILGLSDRFILADKTSLLSTTRQEGAGSGALLTKADDCATGSFNLDGVAYIYHGCTERQLSIVPSTAEKEEPDDAMSGQTNTYEKPAELRPVKLQVIEQVTQMPTAAVSPSPPQVKLGEPSLLVSPTSPNAPRHPPVIAPRPAKQSANTNGGHKPAIKRKPKGLAPSPPVSAMPLQQSPRVKRRASATPDVTTPPSEQSKPSPAQSTSNGNLASQTVSDLSNPVVERIVSGKTRVGVIVLVVDVSGNQAALTEQKDYFLKLRKVMFPVTAPVPIIVVSTKNDLIIRSADLAKEREEWAEDLGKELGARRCFHVSCEPFATNVCYMVDSLLAMGLGGEMPNGEPSYIRLMENHQAFLAAGIKLASLLAKSCPEPCLSWSMWKECSTTVVGAYKELVAADSQLGAGLARCLYRYRILQCILTEHVQCCFPREKYDLSRIQAELSVGKVTVDDMENIMEDPQGHCIWKKVKSALVFSRPVPKATSLYNTMKTVMRNCSVAVSCPPMSSSDFTVGQPSNSAGNAEGDKYIQVEKTNTEHASSDDSSYEIMEPYFKGMPATNWHSQSEDGEEYVLPAAQVTNAVFPVSPRHKQVPGLQPRKRNVSEPIMAPQRMPDSPKAKSVYFAPVRSAVQESSVVSTSSNDEDTFSTISPSSSKCPRALPDSVMGTSSPKPPSKLLPTGASHLGTSSMSIMNRAQSISQRPPAPFPRDRVNIQLPDVVRQRLEQVPSTSLKPLHSLPPPPGLNRQISRSMEDLHKLCKDVSSATRLPQRRGLTQRFSREYKNIYPFGMSPSAAQVLQKSMPKVNGASQEADGRSAKSYGVGMKGAATIEAGKTFLRLEARHPSFQDAWFDITISADTRTDGWEQAMADLKMAKKISLTIRK